MILFVVMICTSMTSPPSLAVLFRLVFGGVGYAVFNAATDSNFYHFGSFAGVFDDDDDGDDAVADDDGDD